MATSGVIVQLINKDSEATDNQENYNFYTGLKNFILFAKHL